MFGLFKMLNSTANVVTTVADSADYAAESLHTKAKSLNEEVALQAAIDRKELIREYAEVNADMSEEEAEAFEKAEKEFNEIMAQSNKKRRRR